MFPPSRECWRSWLLPPRPAASRLKPRSESLPVERAGPAGAFGGDFGLHLRRYFEANFDWYRTTAAVLSHMGTPVAGRSRHGLFRYLTAGESADWPSRRNVSAGFRM